MRYPKHPTPEQVRDAEKRLAELVKSELAEGRIVRDDAGFPCCADCKKRFATRQAVWVHYGKVHGKITANPRPPRPHQEDDMTTTIYNCKRCKDGSRNYRFVPHKGIERI